MNFAVLILLDNSTPKRFPSYLLLYILFIIYLPWCTLSDFPSMTSQASLLFLSCHRTATLILTQIFIDFWIQFFYQFCFIILLKKGLHNSNACFVFSGHIVIFLHCERTEARMPKSSSRSAREAPSTCLHENSRQHIKFLRNGRRDLG